jgi:ferredoxin
MLSVRVDRDRCTGHGICESVVPTVFEVQPVSVAMRKSPLVAICRSPLVAR